MSVQVTIDGVALHRNSYRLLGDEVSLVEAPAMGSKISIVYGHRTLDFVEFTGDGTRCDFWLEDGDFKLQNELDTLVADVLKLHEVPVVADALERLKAAIILAKPNEAR
jgi:hypothetical protein